MGRFENLAVDRLGFTLLFYLNAVSEDRIVRLEQEHEQAVIENGPVSEQAVFAVDRLLPAVRASVPGLVLHRFDTHLFGDEELGGEVGVFVEPPVDRGASYVCLGAGCGDVGELRERF